MIRLSFLTDLLFYFTIILLDFCNSVFYGFQGSYIIMNNTLDIAFGVIIVGLTCLGIKQKRTE